MPYYLYVQPTGYGDVTDYPLDLSLFPGYELLSQSEERPDVSSKRYVNGQWVRASAVPEYVEQRRAAYPALGDQMDMIWHAMDQGLIPKIEPLYSTIKAVKEQFPKPTNG